MEGGEPQSVPSSKIKPAQERNFALLADASRDADGRHRLAVRFIGNRDFKDKAALQALRRVVHHLRPPLAIDECDLPTGMMAGRNAAKFITAGVLRSFQRLILRNALDLLAPGGLLIYSTCSLEREENEQVTRDLGARVQRERGELLRAGIRALRP